MAREEHDREDLLREATALVARAEVMVGGRTVVMGFRTSGAASFFFDDDPVLQFNTQCQLRRAYRGGRLLKAERGLLCELERRRTATETQLLRTPLNAAQTAAFLQEARALLAGLAESLAAGDYQLVGEVPSGGRIVARVCAYLAELPPELTAALVPHAL